MRPVATLAPTGRGGVPVGVGRGPGRATVATVEREETGLSPSSRVVIATDWVSTAKWTTALRPSVRFLGSRSRRY